MALPRAAWAALVSLLALVAIVLAAGSWLWYSSAGLQWLAARASSIGGVGLRIDGVAGTLARGAQAQSIRFATDNLSLEVRNARFTLAPLPELALHFEMLHAERVAITVEPSDEARSPLPDSIALPVRLAIDDASIGTLVFDNGTNVFDLQDIHLRFRGGRRAHRIEALDWKAYGHAFALRGAIDAQRPFALQVSFAAVRPAEPNAQIAGTARGNLLELALNAHARSNSATAELTMTLRPQDAQPLAAVRIAAQDIDPHALDARLPQARLQIEAELRRTDSQLQGPLRLHNRAPGPIDRNRVPLATLEVDLVTNFSTLGFTALRADLGAAGVVTGSGTVHGEEARLELATNALDLRALYSKLRPTQLSGRAMAHLTPTLQSVRAQFAQDDIRLALEAQRNGSAVNVPTLSAQARGGVARGTAQIDLAGAQPFSLVVDLSRFDPAAWGDFPKGVINANLQARGSVQDQGGRVAFEVHDSRWLGAPLAAKGNVQGNVRRIAQADIEVSLGGNRLLARGAFGAKGDTLRVRLDAPHLDQVDKAVRGRLHGTGAVSGTFSVPRFEIDATGAGLAHAQYGSVATVQVAGEGSLDPNVPMTLRAAASGIRTSQLSLRSARLSAQGDRASHSVSLEAAGGPLDLRLRVRGALTAQHAWRGTLLELTNGGELPLSLARPVDLRIAPDAVHVEPFELSAIGGHLSMRSLDYTKERLRTEGSFRSLPVARLIALAGKEAPVRGDLRLSGRWDLSSSPRLRGTVAVARESGDLSIAGKQPLALGLSALSLDADITPQRIDFRAVIETALASAHGSGRVGAVEAAGPLPYTADSPLEFTAKVDIARLAPVAEEFIETPLVLRGQAHASLQGRGTISEPQITGEVTASGLTVSVPTEGVSLGNGSLRATLTPQAIRLEAFEIHGGQGVFTARGTLAREGFGTASVQWQADNFTALGRPDRKLVVSGQGTAGLENKRIALDGKLRVVAGEFEIGHSELPTLSSDVVVVGRKPAPPPAERRFENLAFDLNLDLGKAMHVSGNGLSVWLAGELRVFTNAAGQLRAKGTVNTRDGTFQAYGQRLSIDRGNLYFGGPLDDPALDVVALRKRLPVEAGVALTGTLKNPLVRIVSDPPVPQGEALSWLVLGRSTSEAGKGELSALPLAGNLLLGKATSPLKGALHLDELSVSSNTAGQFVTFGKRLTDRLYLVFEQGIEAAKSLLRLEYNVSRRVTLRLETGTAENSGGGIFYRRRWD